jgi:hypothetical protein
MSRRRRLDDSSLELLLDTICNTFGGVLFLAMLISLLLTQNRKGMDAQPADPSPAVSTADLVRLETRAEDAARELQALETQVRQARQVAGHLEVPDAESLITDMEAAEQRARESNARRTALLARVAAEQAAAARSAAAKAKGERERSLLADKARRAREQLEAAIKDRERLVASAIRIHDAVAQRSQIQTTGRVPRMRSTNKPEFGIMIKYGRLYLMKKLQNGEQVVNLDDFTLEPGFLMNVAEAKPHAGIDLTMSAGRDAALRRVTGDFTPSRWYVCLVVHPDSFEEYLIAKNWLVERGYEIRLFPTDTSVNDQGEVDAMVQ